MIVVAEHSEARHSQRRQFAGEDACFFSQSRVGEIAGEQQQLRGVRHLREQLLKRAVRCFGAVQIADGGHANDCAVGRLTYGCHGGSLAGNDSAIRLSISASLVNLPCSTVPPRRRIKRTPATAAAPAPARTIAPAMRRRARPRDLNKATPAGAIASTDWVSLLLVPFFTAGSFLAVSSRLSQRNAAPSARTTVANAIPKAQFGAGEYPGIAPRRGGEHPVQQSASH
jgi:hypothetical protein